MPSPIPHTQTLALAAVTSLLLLSGVGHAQADDAGAPTADDTLADSARSRADGLYRRAVAIRCEKRGRGSR